MWSNGTFKTGTLNQEHFRSLCIYLGAPREVAHAREVFEELKDLLTTLPSDIITLEAALTARRLDVLKAVEDSVGKDMYVLTPFDAEHSIWLRTYHIGLPADVRAYLARRFLDANKDAFDSNDIQDLIHTVQIQNFPEMVGMIYEIPDIPFRHLRSSLFSPFLYEKPGVEFAAKRVAALWDEVTLSPDRMALSTHSALSCDTGKFLAVLALKGAIDPKHLDQSVQPDINALVEKLKSGHGVMELHAKLKSIEAVLAIPHHDVQHTLLKALS